MQLRKGDPVRSSQPKERKQIAGMLNKGWESARVPGTAKNPIAGRSAAGSQGMGPENES